ncbi:hypothetical protein D3C87_86370 [compost metagenome]
MRNSFLAALLLLFSCFSHAAPKKEALVVGGGGEPSEERATIFDSSYGNTMDNLNSAKWNVVSFFDGGHIESQDLADEKTDGKNKPFYAQDFNSQLDSYIRQINDGTLKKDDQLLVSIMTHGWLQEGKEVTHKISTTDKEVDLDKLKKLRDLAEAKGVKLGILDMSCFSGATLKLGSDKTCVLSLATEDKVGYTTASEKLGYFMTPGSNLEEAFLKSRKDPKVINPGQPQISTKAGRRVMDETLFLRFSMEDELQFSMDQCHSSESAATQKLVKQLQDINSKSGSQNELIEKMKDSLNAYSLVKRKAQEAFSTSQKLNKEEVCFNFDSTSRNCMPFSAFENIWNNPLAKSRLSKKEITLFEKVRRSSDFSKWKKSREVYEENLKKLNSLYKQVAHAEKEAYDILYQEFSRTDNSPNPCRDFKI